MLARFRHTVALTTIGAFSLSIGCATIVSDRRYNVTVDNPSGSTYFTIKDRKSKIIHSGVTPQQVTLDARSSNFLPAKYKVTYAGSGSATQTKELNAGVDPWIAGNLIIGAVPGLIVDGVSGAMWKLPSRIEGNVSEQYTVTDTRQGETLAKAEVPRTITSEKPNDGVRQATASTLAAPPVSTQR